VLEKLKNLKGVFFRIDSRTVYLYSFIIGCLTGAVAILFYQCIHSLTELLFDQWARFPLAQAQSTINIFDFSQTSPRYFVLIFLPALGGLLVGLIT
jgi:H+/Cl- antiporter ClcA